MRRLFQSAAVVLAVQVVLLFGSCIEAPEVIQGTVVSFDASANTVTIRDECPPGEEIIVSLEGAEIGAEPEPEDTVRVAFRVEGDRRMALRVMNLTRQKEIGVASDTSLPNRCPSPQKR